MCERSSGSAPSASFVGGGHAGDELAVRAAADQRLLPVEDVERPRALVDQARHALQSHENMGHADVLEHPVVEAERAPRVHVEALQHVVDPRRAPDPVDHGEIGRRLAEPLLGPVLGHRRHHEVSNGRGIETRRRGAARKHQIVQRHLVGDAEIVGGALVALELQRMAAQAIVHVQRHAALQRRQIAQIRLHGLEFDTRRRAVRVYAEQQQGGDAHRQRSRHVTRSGGSLVFSTRVYQGISTK